MSTWTRRPPRGRRRGEPGAQIGLDIGVARRLDQQAKAVAAAHHGERRLGRAEHADPSARGAARRKAAA